MSRENNKSDKKKTIVDGFEFLKDEYDIPTAREIELKKRRDNPHRYVNVERHGYVSEGRGEYVLSYLDLLIPILSILNHKKSIKKTPLKTMITTTGSLRQFDASVIIKHYNKALVHLASIDFIYDDGIISITSEGSQFINEYNRKLSSFDDREEQRSLADKALMDITQKLLRVYDFPSEDFFNILILEHINENNSVSAENLHNVLDNLHLPVNIMEVLDVQTKKPLIEVHLNEGRRRLVNARLIKKEEEDDKYTLTNEGVNQIKTLDRYMSNKITIHSDLTYLEVIIPSLSILRKSKGRSLDDIQEVIYSNIVYEDKLFTLLYDKESIYNVVDNTLKYLKNISFVNYYKHKYQLTKKGRSFIQSFNANITNLNKLHIDKTYKLSKKIQLHNTRLETINQEIINQASLPTQKKIITDLIHYLQRNLTKPSSIDVIRDGFTEYMNYPDNLTSIINYNSRSSIIYDMITNSIHLLRKNKLIINTPRKGYILSEKLKTKTPKLPEDKNDKFLIDAKAQINYLKLLLPIIKEIQRSRQLTLPELQKIIIGKSKFSKYNKKDLMNTTQKTVYHLKNTGYIEYHDNTIIPTNKALIYINDYENKIKKIITNNNNKYTRQSNINKLKRSKKQKINHELQISYQIPDIKNTYKKFLTYLSENPDHIIDQKQLILDFIQDNKYFTKNMTQLLNINEENLLYHNTHTTSLKY